MLSNKLRAVKRAILKRNQVSVSGTALVVGLALLFGVPYFAAAQTPDADLSPIGSDSNAPATAVSVDAEGNYYDKTGYRVPKEDESEFNNHSSAFVRDWRKSDVDYEDSEFGEIIYNEPSTPTKLEILRLLSKDTPSTTVLMQALSMGLDIEQVLQASVRYEPNKSSELTSSAVSLLPILAESANYLYSGYELEDLEREDDTKPYKVKEVVEKFFEQRLVLRPYPDWFEGQYHFLASAAELKELQAPQKDVRWYRTKSTVDVTKRPIFVSLYEATESVLIDGEERIDEALAKNPEALLPVVFIFNRLNERAIDQLGYPATIRGTQNAYVQKQLMLTPVPEWQLGEYHMYSALEEFYEVFDIPEEEDFEPEAWQRLLDEAEAYSVTNTAFLAVVVGGPKKDGENNTAARLAITEEQLIAAWDDPRTESDFPYVQPENGSPATLKNIQAKGLIFNRPDLIAALNALGVTKVPVSFYYLDSSRIKPFLLGKRGLENSIKGIIPIPVTPSTGGFTPCASPPCVDQ